LALAKTLLDVCNSLHIAFVGIHPITESKSWFVTHFSTPYKMQMYYWGVSFAVLSRHLSSNFLAQLMQLWQKPVTHIRISAGFDTSFFS
jgi:hypothetical protein